MSVIVKLIKRVNREQFIQLYKEANWWLPEYDKESLFIDKIVSGSFLFSGAFDKKGQMVGMGRALSDGCSDAYIQDVVVLKSHKKQGIGREIVKFLISELIKHNIDWIGLIGEPGTESFYEKLGFQKMVNCIPMKFEK